MTHSSPGSVLDWAVSRWHAEVKNRPLRNVHRRSLDDTWRQIIRYLGGDDEGLCGPRHDDLVAAFPAEAVRSAPAQAAPGDPVAWRYCHKGQGDWCMLKDGQDPTKWLATFNGEYEIQPLYAAPPQGACRKALEECLEVLELVEHPKFVDPAYGAEVAALGERIGFGALMSSASASWRKYLERKNMPLGGEFVAGPCHATVLLAIKKARDALSRPEQG